MTTPQHHWQDARLKKALENAPDAHIRPSAATRKAIIDTAYQANPTQAAKVVRPTPKKPANWLLRLNQFLFDSPRISWSALGSLLVVGCVALLWSLNDPKEILSQGDLLQPPVAAPVPTLPVEAPQQTASPLESFAEKTSTRERVITESALPITTLEQTTSNEDLKLADAVTAADEQVSAASVENYEKTSTKEIARTLPQKNTLSRNQQTVDQSAAEKFKDTTPVASNKEMPVLLTQNSPQKPIEQKVENLSQQQIEITATSAHEPMSHTESQIQGSSSVANKRTLVKNEASYMKQDDQDKRGTPISVAANKASTESDAKMSSSPTEADTFILADLATSSGNIAIYDEAENSISAPEAATPLDLAGDALYASSTSDIAISQTTTKDTISPLSPHLGAWDSLEIQQLGVVNVLTRTQSKELPTLITRILQTTARTQQPLAHFTPPKTDVIVLRFFEKQQLRGTLYVNQLNWFFIPQPNKTQTVMTGTLTAQDAKQIAEKLKHLRP